MDAVAAIEECLRWLDTLSFTIGGYTFTALQIFLTVWVAGMVVGLLSCIIMPGNIDGGE